MTFTHSEHNEKEWERASLIRVVLEPFVETGFETKSSVRDVCQSLNISRSTAYRYLKLLQDHCSTSKLKRGKPGRRPLSTEVDGERANIIDTILRRDFLNRQKNSFSTVCENINIELESRGLPKVSKTAVENRRKVIPDREVVLKREGSSGAAQSFRIINRNHVVTSALDEVQIDHTKLDIFVVDDVTREVLGRPHLTISIDIATRAITGCFLSMEYPSVNNLMLAFTQSVLPKATLLSVYDFKYDYPVYGLPKCVSTDNGIDFKSKAFTKGLDEYGIRHKLRPPACPRYGGHVERFFGTVNTFIHTLPGTTFSDINEKGTYDAPLNAVLSLRELEKLLFDFILGKYMCRFHCGLGNSPLNAWNEAWKEQGLFPRLPKDLVKFRRDFLPFEYRVIQREGVELFGMFYRSKHLQKMKNCGIRTILVKYDPRDIRSVECSADGEVFYRAECDKQFDNIISLLEWKKLSELRRQKIAEQLIAPSVMEMHNLKQATLAEAKRKKQHKIKEHTYHSILVHSARSLLKLGFIDDGFLDGETE